jgi:hypothetical protein
MGDEDMLRGLDAVDWGSLSHAFGPAENVPELLGKLISEDADTRWEAYDELTNTVWHQGTVYSFGARGAVPDRDAPLARHTGQASAGSAAGAVG